MQKKTSTQSFPNSHRNGEVSTKSKDLKDFSCDFLNSLYKGQQPSKEAMAKLLDNLSISFTNAMNEELIKPFNTLEFFKAIEGMANGKAQGHDGILIEFLKVCWHLVGEEFF